MKANTRTPAEVFGYHLRYVIPLFQRPYVWTEAQQWSPLWDDIRTLTERIIDTPAQPFGANAAAPHFLGAVVVEQQTAQVGFIAVWHVVDGQQRLTTLQLLLSAAQKVVEQHGSPIDSQALRVLVRNEPSIAQNLDEQFKVWPTDRDQAAFRSTMDDATPGPVDLAPNRIAQAHAYFVAAITEWAEPEGDPDKVVRRLNGLVQALRDHLKIVVIDLEQGDNAQVIFETLNHRGTALLAADLIKNLIFQVAQAQHLDVLALYRQYWRRLDDDAWRNPVNQGRFYRPKIDVFMNYWLTMKLLREVPSDRIYADFRDYLTASANDVTAVLAELARDAGVFSQLDKLPPDSLEGRFYYRVIVALDAGVVTPVLLWLLRWPTDRLPVEQRQKALLAIESWLVRRTLVRVTSKAHNLLLLELLRVLDRGGPETAGDLAERFLAEQTADSRLWPDDTMVQASMKEAPLYTSILRPRLRMVLEALEDDARTAYGEGQQAPRGLSIEHILPQSWRENWPLTDPRPDAEAERDRAVHRLGNLTLVSGKLNPALSNRAWVSANGKGKRDYLLTHSDLKLNARIAASNATEWTDEDIARRSEALAERICEMWQRPSTGQPTGVLSEASYEKPAAPPAPVPGEPVTLGSDHAGKYRELWSWLRDQTGDQVYASFGEVEEVLGMRLPPSALEYPPHWQSYDGSALARAIIDAGWRASRVNLSDGRVTFVRQPDGGHDLNA